MYLSEIHVGERVKALFMATEVAMDGTIVHVDIRRRIVDIYYDYGMVRYYDIICCKSLYFIVLFLTFLFSYEA